MENDFEIGRVVAVDTAEVTIELSRELKALTQSTFEGVREIGKINSYVIMPVGARRLVAIITKVVLIEEAELKADRTMVTLPSARRLMKATLIGTIDGSMFTQGIATFPVLDNPVQVATQGDLQTIFDLQDASRTEPSDPKNPGFCIEVGRSTVFEDFPVKIDPDAFFGKHAAILGSTGSGKSCTIASIIQSILSEPDVHQTNIVILDTNGEYRSAFMKEIEAGRWQPIGNREVLYIPSDPRAAAEQLAIPYWFMNADDFVRLFRAREGLQAPVLLRSLMLSRSGELTAGTQHRVAEVLRTACYQIISLTENDSPNQQWAIANNIIQRCNDGLCYENEFPGHISNLNESAKATFENWKDAIGEIHRIASEANNAKVTGCGLGATRIQRIHDLLDPVVEALNAFVADTEGTEVGTSADQPVFFDRHQFMESALSTAMREQTESGNPARIKDACGPMLLRIRRFFEDSRFNFLFRQYPNSTHVLAAFIRDVLGLPSAADPKPPLSSKEEVPSGNLPFYDRQRNGSQNAAVVILDLSLLAAEVLENVTALIGRLILEFMQRLGELGGENLRGSLPVVLVLEEAQNYIHEQRFGDDESISRVVFERIAREGRKYGLSLVVSSQRPSELSKTVLSQCSSFIVHRLQNPEDLRYFKEIVPGIYGPLLAQVSALAPQTALILGECVRAPMLARIREARPTPRSRDPKFYAHWVNADPKAVPVEAVCRKWEGKDG